MARLTDADLAALVLQERRCHLDVQTAKEQQAEVRAKILSELERRKTTLAEVPGFRIRRKANTTKQYDLDLLKQRIGRRAVWSTITKTSLIGEAVKTALDQGKLNPEDLDAACTGSTTSAEYLAIEPIDK